MIWTAVRSPIKLYHVVFLEVCLSMEVFSWIKPDGVTAIGFNIKETPYVGKASKSFLFLREKELTSAQFKSTELTIIKSAQKSYLETEFISKFSLYTIQEDLLKTRNCLE